jgi:hypothetical protein
MEQGNARNVGEQENPSTHLQPIAALNVAAQVIAPSAKVEAELSQRIS